MRHKLTIARVCGQCGKTFLVEAYQIKRGKGKWCSVACCNAARTIRSILAIHTVPVEDRFWKHVDKSGECWLWTGYLNRAGYGSINIGGKPKQQIRAAHRFSYELAYGSIPDGFCVCHHCDTPACVRPEHLFLGTHADNAHDRDQKGRSAKGERHGAYTHPDRFGKFGRK